MVNDCALNLTVLIKSADFFSLFVINRISSAGNYHACCSAFFPFYVNIRQLFINYSLANIN